MEIGQIMRLLLICSILVFLCVPAYATVQVLRWPSNVPIAVCVPYDTNPGCGGGTPTINFLLLEDSSFILLEDGTKLIL